jgi:voltage-gated potassium channel
MKRAIEWWTKLSPTFLQVLGIVFLAGYAWPIINPNLSPALHSLCNWTLFIIWILFAIDYFARLSVAKDKKLFVRKNLLDLAAVALPFLPLLRAIRALAAVTVMSRRNRGSRSQQVTTSVVTLAFATWFVAGLAVTEAERLVDGANIQGVGDGWWWAITTMATVGYGDTYPVSTQGRIVGTALMIMGVALLGTITASIASNFNRSNLEDSADGKSSVSDLDALKKRVAELENK